MDKRWILIIIIAILAVCCGYLVVSSSNTVGNAIVDVNKSTVTIPPHFSVGQTNDISSVELYKKSSTEKIFIKDLGKKDNAQKYFNKKLDSFSKNEDIKILKNETNSTDEFKYYSIYYQEYSNLNASNQSLGYLHKYEHIYLLKFSGFNDIDQMNDDLDIILNTIKLDYKKSQE